MSSAATEFAHQHCRARDIDPLDKYILLDLRDNVAAVVELTTYYDALAAIPKTLPYEVQKQYKKAVAQRCVTLARESMATAHEFDLR